MHDIPESLINLFSAPSTSDSYFLSFEGIEGAGKSTQIHLLKKYLESLDYEVILLREPGGTPFGEKLREAILSSKSKIHPMAEAHLFASSRAQLLQDFILPKLETPKSIIICDRYIDSSLAYQGEARKLGMQTILEIHRHFPLTTMPHLTFYIKISLETSLYRQNIRNNHKDYFEAQENAFYQSLIDGYNLAALTFPSRICTIDGEQSSEQVTQEIIQNTKKMLKIKS